jgi:hypothetical protein
MRTSTLRAATLSTFALVACFGSSALPAPRATAPHPNTTASQGRHAFVPSPALPWVSLRIAALGTPVHMVRRDASGGNKWIYTAQFYGDDLGVYRQGHGTLSFSEELTYGVSGPQGTVTTRSGWWYVANGGDQDVLVYKTTNTGPSGPLDTLQDAGEIPGNVSVTSSRNLVAVSNESSASGGPGGVSVYLNRSAVPNRTLTYGNDLVQGEGVAVDRNDDCFWSFNDLSKGGGSIVEFPGCIEQGVVIATGLGFAGGLVFDQSGNLYYIDQTAGIYACKKVASCSLFATGFGDPVNLNFEMKQKYLWVADATGYIDAVDPKTGKIVLTKQAVGGSSDPPIGIAPAPGAM